VHVHFQSSINIKFFIYIRQKILFINNLFFISYYYEIYKINGNILKVDINNEMKIIIIIRNIRVS